MKKWLSLFGLLLLLFGCVQPEKYECEINSTIQLMNVSGIEWKGDYAFYDGETAAATKLRIDSLIKSNNTKFTHFRADEPMYLIIHRFGIGNNWRDFYFYINGTTAEYGKAKSIQLNQYDIQWGCLGVDSK